MRDQSVIASGISMSFMAIAPSSRSAQPFSVTIRRGQNS
jgi:hypothetical protein